MPHGTEAAPAGVLRRIGGRTVTAADVGEHVLRHDPEAALRAIEVLAEAAVVEEEAALEGVSVPEAAAEAATDRAMEERRRSIRLDHGAGVDPDAVLVERYGRTPAAVREDLRAAVRTRMLRDRLVRLSQVRADGVEIRVIVFPDEASAAAAARQVRGGADPTLLARKLGLRAPAAPPPLTREDVPEPAVRESLFGAASGAVLDPMPFDAEDPARPGETRRAWQVFKVVRSWRGSEAPWAEIAAEVEASLAAAPVREAEVRRWRARAEARIAAAAAARGTTAAPDGTPESADDAAKGLAPPADAR